MEFHPSDKLRALKLALEAIVVAVRTGRTVRPVIHFGGKMKRLAVHPDSEADVIVAKILDPEGWEDDPPSAFSDHLMDPGIYLTPPGPAEWEALADFIRPPPTIGALERILGIMKARPLRNIEQRVEQVKPHPKDWDGWEEFVKEVEG